MKNIKAVTFDVFGTLLKYDGCPWIYDYVSIVGEINKGARPYITLSEIFREIGADYKMLQVRPGVIDTLGELRWNYMVSALSNADVDLMLKISHNFMLRWNFYVRTETAKCFKPHPRFYCNAMRQLGFKEHEVLHVAAHQFDLEGAQNMGLRTALLNWPGYIKEPIRDCWDLVVTSMEELVEKLSES